MALREIIAKFKEMLTQIRTHAALQRHKCDVNASLTCLRFLTSGFACAKRTLPSLKRGSRSDGSRSHHLVWRRDQSDRGGVPELLVLLFPTAVRLTRTYEELCHVVAPIPAPSRGGVFVSEKSVVGRNSTPSRALCGAMTAHERRIRGRINATSARPQA